MDGPQSLIEIKDNELLTKLHMIQELVNVDKITVAYSYSELNGNQNEEMEISTNVP